MSRSGAHAPARAAAPVVARSIRRFTPAGSVALFAALWIPFGFRPARTDPQLVTMLFGAVVSVLVAGVLLPGWGHRRVRVSAEAPVDAVVGDEVPVRVTVAGTIGSVTMRVLDPEGPWHRTALPATGELVHRCSRRGVFTGIRVEVRSSWPLGLFVSGRVHLVPLTRPIHVAPRPIPSTVSPRPLAGEAASTVGGSVATDAAGSFRSVRPYVQGDPPRLVHWPTSARTGTIVVRELDPPVRMGLAVVVVLDGPPDGMETIAGRAAGVVDAVMAAGGEVLLLTHDLEGPVARIVRSRLEAGRRLAAAMPGRPPEIPAGWPVEVVGR